jgi:hypothetical protein
MSWKAAMSHSVSATIGWAEKQLVVLEFFDTLSFCADRMVTSIMSTTEGNYASQQNAIPVVKELRRQNDGTLRKDLTIRVTMDPAFAEPAKLRIQSLDAAAEFRVVPLDLNLLDFATGHLREQTILSVGMPRSTLEHLNFAALDPSDAMTVFPHRMGFKRSQGFSAIPPLASSEYPILTRQPT